MFDHKRIFVFILEKDLKRKEAYAMSKEKRSIESNDQIFCDDKRVRHSFDANRLFEHQRLRYDFVFQRERNENK